MIYIQKIIVLFIWFLLYNSLFARAQDKKKIKVAWAELSFGPSYTHAFGSGASFNLFISKYNLVTFGIHSSALLSSAGSTAPHTTDVSAMFGKGYAGKYFLVSASAGLALSYGYYTDYPYNNISWYSTDKDFITPAVPLQARVLFMPVRYFGVGATAYHSFNLHKSQGFIGAVIAVGVMREKVKKANPE